jgi:hypothetical protein
MLILKTENWKPLFVRTPEDKVGDAMKSLLNRGSAVRLWTPPRLSNVWDSDQWERPDLGAEKLICIITVPPPTVTEQGLPISKPRDAPQN